MASRIPSLCFLLTTVLLIGRIEGNSPIKLTLSFTELSPPEVIVQRNHPLLLNCSGNSSEGPLEITWQHQGSSLGSHQKVLSNGSLLIEKVVSQKKHGRRDDGNYTCFLHNSIGTLVSRPIQVSIARMSRTFDSEPQPLAVHVGENARFTCQIHAVPPAVISWYHNDHELPQNDSRYTLLPSGILQISGVSLNDAGNYYCRGTNIARQRVSKEAALTVLNRPEQFQPPSFLSNPESLWAVSKDSVVLECIVNGSPEIEISWGRDDNVGIPKQRTAILGTGNLLIKDLQTDDGGIYVCTAKSLDPDSGQASVVSQRTSLSVFVPPKFTSVPESQVKPTAQTARFECAVDGTPVPSVQWLKDGVAMHINGRIKLKNLNEKENGNTLVISQTIVKDSGIYQCIASNAAGVNIASARLEVTASRDQPDPPRALRARAVSSTSIELIWEAAKSPSGLSIRAYTVHYLPTLGGMETQTVVVNTSHVIEKLMPYTNYTFYVRAYNGKSASEQSENVTQMTGEDVPTAAPTVSLTGLSPTTLNVSWNKLPPEKNRGVVNHYRIFYRTHNGASERVIELNATETQYTITDLMPKVKYDVRVIGGTRIGFPNFSEKEWPWVVYEMPDDVPTKVPVPPKLHLTVVNTTAIEVEWSIPPENNFVVKTFLLSYRQRGHPFKGPINLPANTTKFLLTNLASRVWYEVHLIARNSEGDSIESFRDIKTFPGDHTDADVVEVVDPPYGLEAYPRSSTSIHLTWKQPETGKNISYYTVRYHPVSSNGLVNVSLGGQIRSTSNEVVLANLKPFTSYAFAVQSHEMHNQQSPFSQTVQCKTKEDVPSAPLDLTWAPVDTNSVRLNWKPPKYPNGIITKYLILYNMHIEDTQQIDKWDSKEEGGSELTTLVSGLASNTVYYFCLKAQNNAGAGAATPIITLNIPVGRNITRFPSEESVDVDTQDPFLGIIVGVSIGIGCIIICAIIIICRNRCCPPLPPPIFDGRYTVCCGNGHLPQLNGHVGSLANKEKRTDSECQELDCFTPMLNHLPNGSTDRHLDTKGGYPSIPCNGRVNGFPQMLLGNSHSSLCSQQNIAECAQGTKEDESCPVFEGHMHYGSSDCMREGSWRDVGNTDDSSTALLSEGNNKTHLDSSSHAGESSSHTYGESNSTLCTIDSSARIGKSSCNTEANPSQSVPSKLVTHSTVPPVSSTSHILSQTLSGESKENCVPSIPFSCSQEEEETEEPRCTSNLIRGASPVSCSEEANYPLLPFSVNAFPSPLSSPRVSQSHTLSEPT